MASGKLRRSARIACLVRWLGMPRLVCVPVDRDALPDLGRWHWRQPARQICLATVGAGWANYWYYQGYFDGRKKGRELACDSTATACWAATKDKGGRRKMDYSFHCDNGARFSLEIPYNQGFEEAMWDAMAPEATIIV